MLWRHFRREVTLCELFETVKALIEASLISFIVITKIPRRFYPSLGLFHNDFLVVVISHTMIQNWEGHF
jgi:hypothetical protein